MLGQPPADPARHRQWFRYVAVVAAYRAQHNIIPATCSGAGLRLQPNSADPVHRPTSPAAARHRGTTIASCADAVISIWEPVST